MCDRTDVLVVGAGVIGVCTAYYLAKLGREVTLLDMGEVGSGSSEHNAGLIVPGNSTPLAHPGVLGQGLRWMLKSDSPFYIKPRLNRDLIGWLWKFRQASNEGDMRRGTGRLSELGRGSLALFNELITEEKLNCDYRTKGWLQVYRTLSGWEEAKAGARLGEFAVESQIFGQAELYAKEPALKPGLVGGVYFPSEGFLNPKEFVKTLARRVQDMGVKIVTGSSVVAAEIEHGKVTCISTATGEYKPQQVVLAAGAWSAELGKLLRLRIPVQAAKGYSVTLQKQAGDPTLALYLSEAKVAVTPLEAGLRLAGTLELSGMDTTINQNRINGILSSAGKYIDLENRLENIEPWSGLRPCTPDGLPIIGRAPNITNLYLATGHCMMGMTLAPVTGKLVAQLLCDQKTDLDLSPYRLDRW